jgi:hypothetical protein
MGGAQHVAHGLVAGTAITTLAARNVMRNEDPVTDMKPGHTRPDFDHFTGDFVAQYERGFLDTVPLHEIAAAYAAGVNPHQQFFKTDFGNGHFGKAHVSIVMIHSYAHGARGVLRIWTFGFTAQKFHPFGLKSRLRSRCFSSMARFLHPAARFN